VNHAQKTILTAPSPASSFIWYLWSIVAAATLYDVGFYWDISWHQTIGRDSVLTPAHIAIYLCGVIGGVTSAFIILHTTFGRDEAARAASIRVWGLRAPLGTFVVAWGGLLMLTSGPFDNWWHNAYGLDAKLNSPPHWVLTAGVFAVQIGGIILVAGMLNRCLPGRREKLNWIPLHLGAMVVAIPLALINNRVLQHSALFYGAVSAAVPIVMIAAATVSERRWGCTRLTAIYSAFVLAFLWILPFFHGSPGLGPVYRNVTRFVPPSFPVLLIVPAFLVDQAREKWPAQSLWLRGAIFGGLFVIVLAAAQWAFADFLMSAYSRNWFFGTQHLPYFIPPSARLARNEFLLEKNRLQFLSGMLIAFCVAVVGSRLGMTAGNWLRRVRR
jgi:hypothetical protein